MARKRLGIQLSSLVSDYNIDVFTAVENACRKKHYDLILFEGGIENDNPSEKQQQFIYKHINRNNIDCLIVSSERFNAIEKAVKSPEEQKLAPVPRLCLTETAELMPFIRCDTDAPYAALISHMIEKHGCRKFNIITGPKRHIDTTSRLSVCLDTLARHGIKVDVTRIFEGSYTEEGGYDALDYFIANGLFPADCIICLNDDIAVGLEDYAKTLGFKVPEHFRIIGFNDTSRASFSYVTMSTLSIHTEEHGRAAVTLAEQIMEGKGIPPQTKLSATVKYRKSCGCLDIHDHETDYINAEGQKVPFPAMEDRYEKAEIYTLAHDIFLMQRFFDNLTASLTVQTVVPELKSWFPTLHIRACAAALFERRIFITSDKDFELPSRAELLFCYEEHARPTAKEFSIFNPQQGLFPQGTFADRERTLIVHSLYYDNFIYGYLAFEPGDLPKPLYDTTFSMVANMINSAVMCTERLAVERHQSTMLRQLQKSNSRLSGISLTDELTKLYNRRGVLNFGQQTIDLAVEMGNRGHVFYADMDGLKKVNDTFGHDAGDLAITTMGKILRKTFRNQDVIGRMGGDEFVIIATGIDNAFLPRIRERIDVAADQWYATTKPDFRINISFGAVPFDEEHTDLEKLLAEADKLLYEEKLKKHSRSATKDLLTPPARG